ncbi:NifB/NifX family molybdenum-iron cluster-binding protein [Pseudaeromonas sharmana]|uniref:NifB/NifX family molybdenum-iron cluster-binding protein n=1 Tax=Pseudaeromonas sharmana TaxID=328412 RepID=A0ABV8CJZ5_9GAMM
MSTLLESQVYWRLLALAQQLPAIEQGQLFDWVCSLLSGPLNSAALEALTLPQLHAAARPEMASLSTTQWTAMLATLQGELPAHLEPKPVAGSAQGALRAAFASTDGLRINGHFGSCPLFFVYQLTATEHRLIDIRRFSARDADTAGSESNEARAELLGDCQLLFCEAIGGPAAARVIRHGIHPVKIKRDPVIAVQVAELQHLLAGQLPPWLAKALGRKDDLASRFDLETEE